MIGRSADIGPVFGPLKLKAKGLLLTRSAMMSSESSRARSFHEPEDRPIRFEEQDSKMLRKSFEVSKDQSNFPYVSINYAEELKTMTKARGEAKLYKKCFVCVFFVRLVSLRL